MRQPNPRSTGRISARQSYQEAIDAGWTATELATAGLKPPAPPRKRGAAESAVELDYHG